MFILFMFLKTKKSRIEKSLLVKYVMLNQKIKEGTTYERERDTEGDKGGGILVWIWNVLQWTMC